ncbi:NUDIX hydrolase [Agromyces sp. H66]|uniref:NUDIX hydrolase n=1 Tax=Agromyces sp. H66 TaxID=2529859 RepID=UPI0010AA8DCF|nr:NUDIX hydrolase [Agromyces sp. H66]
MTESPRALTTRLAYANPWMRVREDLVRWPGGHESVYGVVEKPDFAVILPRDGDGWWMVEQYRYPIGRRVLEFPQGSWPAGHAGDTLALATAELREETGFTARTMRRIGRMQEAYGFVDQACDVFLATDLEPGDPDREATELHMEHRLVGDDELADLIRAGEVVDAVTIAALTLHRLDAAASSGATPAP